MYRSFPLSLFLLFFTCFFSTPDCVYAEESKTESVAQPTILDQFDKENANREQAEDSKLSDLWSKSLLLLAVAIGVLFIATWFMKRMEYFKPQIAPKDARIRIVERRMLSPKSYVYLLDVDGHKIVVTESINGTQQPYELCKNEIV